MEPDSPRIHRKFERSRGGLWLPEYELYSQRERHLQQLLLSESISSISAPTFQVAVTRVTNSSPNWTVPALGAHPAFIFVIGYDSGSDSLSAVSWNSVSATFLGREARSDSAGAIEIWALANPANNGFFSGSLTWTSGTTPTNYTTMINAFNGVNQSTPATGFQATNGSSTGLSVTVTSSSSSLVVGALTWGAQPPFSSNAGGYVDIFDNVGNGSTYSFSVSFTTGSASLNFNGITLGSAVPSALAACSLTGG